jgi:hypothetical protein
VRGTVCRLGNLPSITGEGLSTIGGRAVVSTVCRVIHNAASASFARRCLCEGACRRLARARAPVVVRVCVSGSRGICSCTLATVAHTLCLGRIAGVSPSPPCSSGSLSLSPSRSLHICPKLQYATLICSISFSRASRRAVSTEVAEQFAKEEVCVSSFWCYQKLSTDDILRRCHRERGDGMERRVVSVPAGGGTISDTGTTL